MEAALQLTESGNISELVPSVKTLSIGSFWISVANSGSSFKTGSGISSFITKMKGN